MSDRGTTWVSDIEGLPRTRSDHNPVRLELHVPQTLSRQFTWRFRSEALLDPIYTHTIREAIIQYFTQNKGSVHSAVILWKAFKATIRGTYFSTTAGILKDLRGQIARTEHTLKGLERVYERSRCVTLLAQIKESITEYNKLAEDEVRYLSRRHVARAYGEGVRPGHALRKRKRYKPLLK